MKSCWNRNPSKRPEANEIYVFLGNNPRLLSPCLETPTAVFEDAELLDLEPSSPLDPPGMFFNGPEEADTHMANAFDHHDSLADGDPREALLPSGPSIEIAMTDLASRGNNRKEHDESSGTL